MRLGGRKPGTITSFIDAFSQDVLLQLTAGDDGETLIAYRLYDAQGHLVEESDGLTSFRQGKEIRDGDDLLLLIPTQLEDAIQYRLYSQTGALLTCSDGARTQLFGGIRIEGTKKARETLTSTK